MGNLDMRSRSRSVERRRRRSNSRDRKRRSRSRSREHKYRKEDQRDRQKFQNQRHNERRDEKKRSDHTRSNDNSQVRIKSEPRADESNKFGRAEMKKEDNENSNEPEKPNMAVSGKLLEDTNVFNGVVIKYSEPEEARKPKRRWRFYVFKGQEQMPVMHLHRQSAYLIGKDRKIADIPVDHPSCSRQHAVLQYRFIRGKVLPYVIDLGSSNGTFLNNNKIDPQRYVELKEKDMLKFGFSSREYILLHENSQDDSDD